MKFSFRKLIIEILKADWKYNNNIQNREFVNSNQMESNKISNHRSLPISVCITTKDNADTIRTCLDSVYKWTDEIVVVDSDSHDGTIEICEEYGANVHQREFKGFADLKSTARDLARNEWVFMLDADEEVPNELKREILEKFENQKIDAFYMDKQNYVMGDWTHHYHEKRPLLAKRKTLYYQEDYLWEHLSVKEKYQGKTHILNNSINHYIFERASEMENKFIQYSALEAIRIVDNDLRDGGLYLFFKGLLIAFHRLFIKKGILDGYRGLFFAFLSFYHMISAWAKVRDIYRLQEKHPEKWRDIWLNEECQR